MRDMILIDEPYRDQACNECHEWRCCYRAGPRWLCGICFGVMIYHSTGLLVHMKA